MDDNVKECEFYTQKIRNSVMIRENVCMIGYTQKDWSNVSCKMNIHCKYNPNCYFKQNLALKEKLKVAVEALNNINNLKIRLYTGRSCYKMKEMCDQALTQIGEIE